MNKNSKKNLQKGFDPIVNLAMVDEHSYKCSDADHDK